VIYETDMMQIAFDDGYCSTVRHNDVRLESDAADIADRIRTKPDTVCLWYGCFGVGHGSNLELM
jgi:hypothetical protein